MVNNAGSSDVWAREGLLERLKALYWEGVSSSNTARILNQEFGLALSRNAVIGKIHRSNFYIERSAAKPETARAPRTIGVRAYVRPSRAVAGRPIGGAAALRLAQERSLSVVEEAVRAPREVRGGRLQHQVFVAKQGPERVPASLPLPGTLPRVWTERRFGECSWVIGEAAGPDTLNCCQPTVTGKSWCERHMQLGTTASVTRNMTPEQRAEHGAKIRAGRARARRAA